MSTNSIVQVENLTVKFGNFYAVDNISFSVKPGEIFGFLGDNGAGKTTTIRSMCGLLNPTAGSITIAGIKLLDHASRVAIKQKIGHMSQHTTLYDDLTIAENLAFIASLRDLPTATYLARRRALLEFIGFEKPLTALVRYLPSGIKQQVSLAAALLHDPELIFLDEPTAGVAPAMRARFWSLIKTLSKRGKTVFVTTHYMDEAENCATIALMREGKLISIAAPKQLKNLAFPNKLFEFEPKTPLNYRELQKLKNLYNFSYFELFGLRFHAAFPQTPKDPKMQEQLSQLFNIKEISPTLEDVFLKTITGSAR